VGRELARRRSRATRALRDFVPRATFGIGRSEQFIFPSEWLAPLLYALVGSDLCCCGRTATRWALLLAVRRRSSLCPRARAEKNTLDLHSTLWQRCRPFRFPRCAGTTAAELRLPLLCLAGCLVAFALAARRARPRSSSSPIRDAGCRPARARGTSLYSQPWTDGPRRYHRPGRTCSSCGLSTLEHHCTVVYLCVTTSAIALAARPGWLLGRPPSARPAKATFSTSAGRMNCAATGCGYDSAALSRSGLGRASDRRAPRLYGPVGLFGRLAIDTLGRQGWTVRRRCQGPVLLFDAWLLAGGPVCRRRIGSRSFCVGWYTYEQMKAGRS
jgi:hypothetical protein